MKEPAATDYQLSLSSSLLAKLTAADAGVSLPTGLGNTRDFSLESQSTEAQTAQAELAQERPRTAANVASVVLPHSELRLLVRLGNTGCLSHSFLYLGLHLLLFALCNSDSESNLNNRFTRKVNLSQIY
jgi:hypothetical protein